MTTNRDDGGPGSRPRDAGGGEPRRYRPAVSSESGGPVWQRYEPAKQSGGVDKDFAPRRGGRRRRGRGRLVGFILVGVLALILGFATGYVRGYLSNGTVGQEVTVVIQPGSSLTKIGDVLQAKGVVRHARAFVIRAQSDGYGTRFLPGRYTFHQNEPYDTLVAGLLKGEKPLTIKVSIPEGTTLKQAAQIVSRRVKSITAADYTQIARDEPPPFKLQGYEKGTTLEGMLFPATYDVAPKATADQFVQDQLDAFDAHFANVDMSAASKANLTEYDVVIIGSMIDREVLVGSERALVAAVIWNRLRKDMPLQIDATVQYALGKTKPQLSFADLKVDSPYNTYLHKGLPPTPISNPGEAAMRAAANPAKVDYLYYVARNDGSGRHYFSSSYAQFQADTKKSEANAK